MSAFMSFFVFSFWRVLLPLQQLLALQKLDGQEENFVAHVLSLYNNLDEIREALARWALGAWRFVGRFERLFFFLRHGQLLMFKIKHIMYTDLSIDQYII